MNYIVFQLSCSLVKTVQTKGELQLTLQKKITNFSISLIVNNVLLFLKN